MLSCVCGVSFADVASELPTGLIIGPRGNTQKRMERETGCKVAIRGKGSQKPGRVKDVRPQPGEEDELHVAIMGDTEAQVRIAERIVKKLLLPIDDEKNVWKQQQLEELARYNGV